MKKGDAKVEPVLLTFIEFVQNCQNLRYLEVGLRWVHDHNIRNLADYDRKLGKLRRISATLHREILLV